MRYLFSFLLMASATISCLFSFAQTEIKKTSDFGLKGNVKSFEEKIYSATVENEKVLKTSDELQNRFYSKFNKKGYATEVLGIVEEQNVLEINLYDDSDTLLIEKKSSFLDYGESVTLKYLFDDNKNAVMEALFYNESLDTVQTERSIYNNENLKVKSDYFVFDDNNVCHWIASQNYTYNENNKILKTEILTAPDYNDVNNLITSTVMYFYNEKGALFADTSYDDSGNSVSCNLYDENMKIINSSELMYDFDGSPYWEILEEKSYDSDSKLLTFKMDSYSISYSYNKDNLLESIYVFDEEFNKQVASSTYTYILDSHGNWIVKYSVESDLESMTSIASVTEREIVYY